MPRLSFITPAALTLLALLPLLWALTFLAPRRVTPWRRWLGLLLRSAILIALVFGIAGAQLVRPVRTLTTVFLLDASDSVAPMRSTSKLAGPVRATMSSRRTEVLMVEATNWSSSSLQAGPKAAPTSSRLLILRWMSAP